MGLVKLCTVTDLVEGEMRDFEVNGTEVIVAWCQGAAPSAFDAACPHQGISLGFGEFDGKHIVCGAHEWSFDARTGEGIYPGGCRLNAHPLRIEGVDVLIDVQSQSVTN
jgi:toluene monooxygenase system ferredoxin subunit